MTKRIWFIRHGEAFKNLHEIHGGVGSTLTERGTKECLVMANRIRSEDFNSTNSVIIGNKALQVAEAIAIYQSVLQCDFCFDEKIKGIHLGVANGISMTELKLISPSDAEQLELWRNKRINLDQLHITGMEPAEVFHSRISGFIKSCFNDNRYQTFIIVCTTSILILIANMLRLQKKFSLSLYYHIKVKTGDFICLNINCENDIELIDTNIAL